jgi:GT2 family glycosyltransferase
MQDRSCIVGCVIVSTLSDSVHPLLNRAISSITKASEKSNVKSKIVVVSSEFNSYPSQLIAPDLFIHTPNHTGYGAMNNAGIGELLKLNFGITHFLLLNDDAYIDSSFFKNLQTRIQNIEHSVDVYVPLIFDNQNKINSFGMEIFQSGYAHDSLDIKTTTVWGTAACILFSKQFVEKMIKRFDMFFNTQLHFYYEDVELAFRGFSLQPKIYKDKGLLAFHNRSFSSGASSDFTVFQTLQSYLWTYIMCWTWRMYFCHSWRFLLVYFWLLLKTFIDRKYTILFKLLTTSYNSRSELLARRAQIIAAYPKDYCPAHFMIPHLFRTRKKGVLI